MTVEESADRVCVKFTRGRGTGLDCARADAETPLVSVHGSRPDMPGDIVVVDPQRRLALVSVKIASETQRVKSQDGGLSVKLMRLSQLPDELVAVAVAGRNLTVSMPNANVPSIFPADPDALPTH